MWGPASVCLRRESFPPSLLASLHDFLCLWVTPQTPAGRKCLEVEKREAMTGQLTGEVRLLHGESRQHAVSRTRALLEQFRLENCEHPVCYLDLAPSDDFLFLHLKKSEE